MLCPCCENPIAIIPLDGPVSCPECGKTWASRAELCQEKVNSALSAYDGITDDTPAESAILLAIQSLQRLVAYHGELIEELL